MGRLRGFRFIVVVVSWLLWAQLPLVPVSPAAASSGNDSVSDQLDELQTPTSITTSAGSSYKTELFTEPVQFERPDGSWAPVSSDLVPTREDGYDLTNESNSFDVLFDESADGDYLQVEVAGDEFSFDLLGSAPSSAESSGPNLTYSDALGETDLRYKVTASGVKETLVLEDADAASDYRFEMTPPADEDFQATEQSDGSWNFFAEGAQEPTFVLEAPVVVDSAGDDGGTSNPASMEVTEVDSTFLIDLSLDQQWLDDPERAFPVMLDPTIETIQEPEDETEDASFAWDCSTCERNSMQRLLIGGDGTRSKWRPALRFDLASLPDYAQISDSSLKVRFDGTCVKTSCGGSHLIDVHRIYNGWAPDVSMPQSFGYASAEVASFQLPSGASPQWMSWNLTTVTRDWFLGETSNHGVLLKRHTEGIDSSGPKPPSSKFSDVTLRPKLVVTWSDSGINLRRVEVVHSSGAELEWTPVPSSLAGSFVSYEIHRSESAGFVPSATTLVSEIKDIDETGFTDTTARPNTTFYYKVVLKNFGATNERSVTTPQAGYAAATLQPGPDEGEVSGLVDTAIDCEDAGARQWLTIGSDTEKKYRGLLRFDLSGIPTDSTVSSAQLSLYRRPTAEVAYPTMKVTQMRTAWTEGTGTGGDCTDDGAAWGQAQPGVEWFGGDLASEDQVETVQLSSRAVAGWDHYSGITNLVQKWISGEEANHGVALSLSNEAAVNNNSLFYYTDDYSVSSQLRPMLAITYQDGSESHGPVVEVGSPTADETLTGGPANPVTLSSVAADDGRVTKVEFLVDGSVVGTDTSPDSGDQFSVQWNPALVANGNHTMKTRAHDDVGQTSTSQEVSLMVDNSTATTTLSSPGNSPLSGTVQLSANAVSPVGIDHVDFLVDGVVVDQDSTAPYSSNWDTLDSQDPAVNGAHELKTMAYAESGVTATSDPVTVTVDNAQTPNTEIYDGKIDFDPASPLVPEEIEKNPDLEFDNLDSTYNQYDPHSLSSAPHDSTAPVGDGGRAPIASTGEPETFTVSLDIANTSPQAWTDERMELWYRWVNSDDEVVYEAPTSAFAENVPAGSTSSTDVSITAPSLPTGTVAASYDLRFDIYDSVGVNGTDPGGTWFSSRGVEVAQAPTQVSTDLEGLLGLEHFFHYDAEPVGAGMSQLTNVANGNSILQWTPMSSPGRGISTVVNLTYNSLMAGESNNPNNTGQTTSPVGSNFSLSVSSLLKFSSSLDIGNDSISFTDGDGTTHTFTKATVNGQPVWQEPPGVNLHLRMASTQTTSDEKWSITRPDRVVFYFDQEGWPTSVKDRNGNTLTLVDEHVQGPDDPGRPHRRIVRVTDPAGRHFEVDYWSRGDSYDEDLGCPVTAQNAGTVKAITDHEGHALTFTYYKHGQLRSIVQEGGVNDDGTTQSDRRFVFSYTTKNGAEAALPNATDRVNPPCDMNNQSSRLFSVRDPNGKETTFSYIAPQGNRNKWKLQSRTNRAGKSTSYSYDVDNRLTTVDLPANRRSVFRYDTSGKVTEIRRSAPNSRVETTSLEWSPDFQVAKVTEPSGKFQTYTYNSNGYLTQHVDARRAESKVTNLTYVEGDHVSDLETVSTPEHGSSDSYTFSYDSNHNLNLATDPEDKITDYDFAPDGTLTQVKDARGSITAFSNYHPSGFPRTVTVDMPTGQPDLVTKFEYDADGSLLWMQSPNQTSNGFGTSANNRTSFYHDSFHRLIKSSSPKLVSLQPGELIWSSIRYDKNDNVIEEIGPHYGSTYRGTGFRTTYEFDAMDRPTKSHGHEENLTATSEMTYDDAGRLDTVTTPEGVFSSDKPHDHFTDYSYDSLDRVAKVTSYDQVNGAERTLNTHYCYQNDTSDLLWVTPPRGNSDFTGCGSAPSVNVKPTPFSTGYTYFGDHAVESITDPEGNKKSFTYTKNDQIKTVTDAQNQTTTYHYDKRDLVTRIDQPFIAGGRGTTTIHEYDAVGNLTKLVSPRAYDTANGASSYDAYATEYKYDNANRLIRTTLPHAPAATQDVFVHNIYEGTNLKATSLPSTIDLPENLPTKAKTSMTYFDQGWIRTSSDGVHPQIKYGYTAEGWQSSRRVRYKKKDTMTWTYYLDGQLKERAENRQGTDGRITYDYDRDNNLTKALDDTGVTSKFERPITIVSEYDWLGRPLKVKRRKGSEAFKFTAFAYDLNGNISKRVDDAVEVEGGSAGRTNEFTYDNADWIATQHDQGPDAAACTDDYHVTNLFTNNGWEDKRTVKRGCLPSPASVQETNWDYFANGKLQTLTTTGKNGAVIEKHDVSYLNGGIYMNGHRTQDKFGLSGPSGSPTDCEPTTAPYTPCTAKFVYDSHDRLIEHENGHGEKKIYSFDQETHMSPDSLDSLKPGNLTTERTILANGMQSSRKDYHYTGTQLQRVATDGDDNYYRYDDQGNLDCVVSVDSTSNCKEGASGYNSNVLADYNYDSLNRLVEYATVDAVSGSVVKTKRSTFEYDALDRTVSQKARHVYGDPLVKTTYSYLGLSNLVSGESSPDSAKSYSYDSAGKRIAMSKAPASGATENYTYGHDVHGSVSLLVNSGGTQMGEVKASYGYDPYGAKDPALTKGDASNTSFTNPYRYSGKRLDSVSGTLDMGARRFGPDIHSFIQRDAYSSALGDLSLTFDPLTQNRYALAGGNPVSFIEWDGHGPIDENGNTRSPFHFNQTKDPVDQDPGLGGYVPADSPGAPPHPAGGYGVAEARRVSENDSNPVSQFIGGVFDAATGRDVGDHADYIAYWASRVGIDPRTLMATIKRESASSTEAPLPFYKRVTDALQVGLVAFEWSEKKTIGISLIDHEDYASLVTKHPEIEGMNADELSWEDLAHDEDLAIRATAYRLSDFQNSILEATNNSNQKIGFMELQERIASAHFTNRAVEDKSDNLASVSQNYLGPWRDAFGDADDFYCGATNFACN